MRARIFPKGIGVVVSVVVICVLSLFAARGFAQVSGATLSGTITDPSGAVVPNAQVSARNTATGVTRAVAADTAGFYSIPNLLPGTYEVTVTAPGFNTARQSNVELGVGAQQQLNIPLKVGETTQTVQVTEAAPQVQLTSSTISSEIQATTVRELPLNGRDWASLATLSPGVNAVEVQMPFESGAVRGNRGFGAQLTISGGKPTQNNYRLDGLSINDYANGGPGSVLGVNLGVDAIQEFSVITGNYSAEYGRTSGGIVNAVSKSGTNGFHGDAYEFLRNTSLDANDFFSNAAGQPTPVYRRNQFGAAVGGPIFKDRTFFFGDYEGVRQTQALPTSNSTVPSDNARLGILAGQTALGFPAGTPCTSGGGGAGHYLSPLATMCVDDNSARYLALIPHANGPVGGNTGRLISPLTAVIREDFFTTRVDHKISNSDSIFATYMFDRTPDHTTDAFDNTGILSQTVRDIAALEWTHTFTPALLNTARLGYNRNAVINSQPVAAINPAAGDLTLGMMLGRANPSLFIGGISHVPAGFPGGSTLHTWNSFQFYDDAFLTRGTHGLKFGFAVERMQYNPFNIYNPNGIARFKNFANFLNNQPTSLEGSFTSKITPRGWRQTLFAGYIQDDWRLRRNLTLNVGLRYEMATVLSENQGKWTNLRNITDAVPYCGTTDLALTSVFGVQGCSGVAPYYTNPTTKDFEPRIGFAWDPFGNGKTAVRGGYAIFDVLPLPGYFFSQAWTPFLLTATATGIPGTLGISPSSPASAYAKLGPKASPTCTSPLGTCSLTGPYVDPNLKRNYVQQWNLNVQRQITPTLTATLGYVGSHGVHMVIRGDDFDMVIPTLTSAGYLWPFNPSGADLRINKNFGLIRGMSFGTDATYEAAEFNIQKRLSHGFQFGGSYTYGKAMDDDSSTILGDAFSNSITTWFWFAPKISHALSDYNVTQTAVINGLWDVPGPKSLHGFAGSLTNGWELGGILKMNSGIPTTPLINGDPMNVENNGSDTFGIPDRVAGCDPVNHNFKNNPNVFLGYINLSCFTAPMATPAIASQCVPFSAVPGSCSNLLGNAGRNSIIGPGLVNLDFSVYKNFPVRKVSESASVQFRSEFFNILNRANFGVPLPFFGAGSSTIIDTNGLPISNSGGVQQPLVTLPRVIQFALKLIW